MPSVMGCTHGVSDPASRFRFLQFVPYLKEAGWTVAHRPCRPPRPWASQLPGRVVRAVHQQAGRAVRALGRWKDIRDAGRFDVVFVNRDLLYGNPAWEARLLHRNPRVVFDFDDAVYEGPGARQAEWMCRHAAIVTAGNETLAAWARRFSDRVAVLPTAVDVGRNETITTRAERHRVGWCGSRQSIDATLTPFLPALVRLQRKLNFELVVMTKPRPTWAIPELRWSFVEWNEDDERRLGRFFDVGIMPLQDTPFQRGKCGLKLLQYMACGLPWVASPVGVNVTLSDGGATGLLAGDERAWTDALRRLLESPDAAAGMGGRGRAFVAQHYDLATWAPVLGGILDQVAGAERGVNPAGRRSR